MHLEILRSISFKLLKHLTFKGNIDLTLLKSNDVLCVLSTTSSFNSILYIYTCSFLKQFSSLFVL